MSYAPENLSLPDDCHKFVKYFFAKVFTKLNLNGIIQSYYISGGLYYAI